MKKAIGLLLLFVAVVQFCVAQDVIITRDSKRIEASVQEISDTEIRYKRQDNPNGPVFVIKTSQVASILFANGEVQSFMHIESENLQIQEKKEATKKGTTEYYDPNKKLEYLGDDMFRYGNERISYTKFAPFLKEACPAAYAKYNEGFGYNLLGYIFAAIGSSCFIAGSTMISMDPSQLYADSGPGLTWMLVGLGIGAVSLPMFIVAKSCKNKSTKIFNENCRYRSVETALSFNVSPSSVGLILYF